MNHPQRFSHAALARGPASRPVVLFLLLAQVVVAGCQPGPEPEPTDKTPAPTGTSAHSLAAAPVEEAAIAGPPQQAQAFRGVLTTDSLLGILDFRYDAFVVTARESGPVTLRADVIEANPNGYQYGYGYPLTMASIEDGVTFTQYGGVYVQSALETGTAVLQYPVQEGRQYILVYRTFGNFTPLKYRLQLPSTLKMEGRIETLPAPVPVTGSNTGPITLENPRPATLSLIVEWLGERVGT